MVPYLVPIKVHAASLAKNGMSIKEIATKLGAYPVAVSFWLKECADYMAAVNWGVDIDALDWSPYDKLREAA